MKSFIFLLISYFTACSFAMGQGQNLTGNWTGRLKQENEPDWSILMEVNIKQSGNTLTGQIKSTIKNNGSFTVEKFRGNIIQNKVTMNEYEVVREYSPTSFLWALKICEGLLETNISENKRVIEGTWACDRVYDNRSLKYVDYDCGNGGTFTISQQLPPKPQPLEKPVVTESIISGQVIDKQTRKPVKSTLSIIGDKSPMQTISTGNDGKYRYNAPINDVSDIEITENGYEPLRESLKIDNANLTRNFFLIPKRNSPPVKEESSPLPPSIVVNGQTLKKGESIALNSIQFEQTKSDLLPEGKAELDKVVQLMKEYPTLIIELSGHTSNEEKNESMNVRLSEERVAACKNYIANQVENANSRVKTVGHGSSKPRASNNSEQNRKNNRRVELKVESL